MPTNTSHADDGKARRAAARIGLQARKSRWRHSTIDNLGGYQLIDPDSNCIVAGERFDLSATDVVEYCSGWSLGVYGTTRRKPYLSSDPIAGVIGTRDDQ